MTTVLFKEAGTADTICLGAVIRERESIFDTPIEATTATLRREPLDGKVISIAVGKKNLFLRSGLLTVK